MSKNSKTKAKPNGAKNNNNQRTKEQRSRAEKSVAEEQSCFQSKNSSKITGDGAKKKGPSGKILKTKASKTCITPITTKSTLSFNDDTKQKKPKERSRKEAASITPLAKHASTHTLTPSPTTPAKKEKEKWSGEDAALSWTKSLERADLMTDYNDIKSINVQDERCKIWAANMNRNSHPDYKCYDDNRVIVQMSKSDYINATKVNIPNFSRTAFLVQMPKLDNIDAVEEFWRMIFTEQCTNVHLIAQAGEIEHGFEKLFAQEAGKYFYANGFFVNTRKVEKNSQDKMDIFVVELLPEGCSNSVICQLYMHSYWKGQSGPEKFHAPMKAAGLIGKTDIDSNPVAIVSVRGAGRNASLLTLAVVVSQFGKGMEPKIKDIVKTIREQRPMSVDSVVQYISLYLATSWLVKVKIPNSEDVKKRLTVFRSKYQPTSSLMSFTTDQEPTKDH